MDEQQMAQLNVTYTKQGGNIQNGTLPDPVAYDTPTGDLVRIAQEAIRNGDIPGIDADPDADLNGFVIDRINASGDLPNRLLARPKTPFGTQK